MTSGLLTRAIDALGLEPQLAAFAHEVFSTWTLLPAYARGEVVGVAFFDAPDIHFVMFPEHRHQALQRRRIEAFLRPLLAEKGYLTTTVDSHRVEQTEFVKRLGFVPVEPQSEFFVCHDIHLGARHEAA